jgi:hypothetical protein
MTLKKKGPQMKFIICLTFLTLSGCAAMQADFENRTCNYDGAFEKGANDAKNGEEMQGSALTYQCPTQTKDAVAKGYREGYASGTQANQATVSAGGITIVLPGNKTSRATCSAQAGKEIHNNFCKGMDQQSCTTHSGVCRWF